GRLEDNKGVHNGRACPGSGEGPATSGGGIGLVGPNQGGGHGNVVNDNLGSGPSPLAWGGVAVVSSIPFGGSPASDNRITDNRLHGNEPFDLSDDGAGTGNRFDGNRCDTSSPAGLCDHRSGDHHEGDDHDGD